ncbi:MAG: ABC transporter permease [Candidatus Anammoxibacter sp.]
MRNCLAIANITFKEIIRQPLFYVIIFSSIVLMLLSSCFTLFAFGEEGRLIKDMGSTTITISGLIIAIFYTANAFTDELKKTTVVTILCKAVNKAGFIIGKFLGTALVVILSNIILLVVFALITSFYGIWSGTDELPHSFFKGVYLAMDNSLLLGVYFAFLQVLILGAICLLLSVLLPAVSNISICFAIYIFGHLSDYLNTYIQKSEGLVMWLPKIALSIIPNLQFFDVELFRDNAFQSHDIFSYLLVTSFYTICYCAIMIVFTIFSFQRKDIL